MYSSETKLSCIKTEVKRCIIIIIIIIIIIMLVYLYSLYCMYDAILHE